MQKRKRQYSIGTSIYILHFIWLARTILYALGGICQWINNFYPHIGSILGRDELLRISVYSVMVIESGFQWPLCFWHLEYLISRRVYSKRHYWMIREVPQSLASFYSGGFVLDMTWKNIMLNFYFISGLQQDFFRWLYSR